jgi:Fic family protein
MKWNWQQKEWPHFKYNKALLDELELDFTHKSGVFLGTFKHIDSNEKLDLSINLICDEALKTSAIEGEYLNRDSLHSSISKNFGLKADKKKSSLAEEGISELMVDLYQNYSKPLSSQTLKQWYSMIISGRKDLDNIKSYRTHESPMQVVSGPIHNPKVHFEAPPSQNMIKEMNRFIDWFNKSQPKAKEPLPTLIRAGIAHLYFVSIHPFEDGNGRIARALAEKSLSQCLGQPTLIALSIAIEKQKKKYYDALDYSNKSLEITDWLKYFSETILEAQNYSQKMVEFLIKKAKFYEKNKTVLNPRQEKVITRIFQEGIEGFKGGLSAENYISITKTSRATATRDLQDLVDKKILDKKGQLKGTRYDLKM